jgi:NAD(P)-dependent dehydrogenase (short-subunit alcohol dehydrogenase family)
MKNFNGRVAAVTGAASGIGRALAVDLAQRGCHVAISDINERELAETVTLCEGHGVKVTSQRLDVADKDGVFEWAESVVADHGSVNLVFNNAGVALGFDVASTTLEDFEWLMGINFWGVVYGTKAFLPHLEAAGEGHIVNVSSVFGLISVPSQSAYNAAKFAVRGFTDSLRMELKGTRSPVSCTTVHPGGVKTNIVRNGRQDPKRMEHVKGDPADAFDKIARTTAPEAAAVILRAVERDRRRVVIGADGKIIDFLGRLPAAVYQAPLTLGARMEDRRYRSSR